jgi:16S rRNA (uracil1498-N3)-methyltransferase
MRETRLFLPQTLQPNLTILLDNQASHYLLHVLRLRKDMNLKVFNGDGLEYQAKLSQIIHKQAQLQILSAHQVNQESFLNIHLVQALAKPEHMDYAIQKAVELGVNIITPLITSRSPPLPISRYPARLAHWQKIIHSACEQCGRTIIPTLEPIKNFNYLLAENNAENRVFLLPNAPNSLQNSLQQPHKLQLIIGAEGGLNDDEISALNEHGYISAHLGNRILRTETATVVALSIAQSLWGDLR